MKTRHATKIAVGIIASVSLALGAAVPAYALVPEDLTSTDLANITDANSWLASQMQTSTDVVTSSTIAPATTYASSFLGSIQGSFDLNDRTYATENNATISVSSPSTVVDSYRGVITGTVLVPPSPGRWIIQAYKRTSVGTTQVPVQALVNGTTGAFSIDVSSVPTSTAGAWELGLLDASASYAPYGVNWPTPDDYAGLEVQQLLVTDATYFWASAPAWTDGTFRFPNSNTGTKLLRLVDTSTNEVLAEGEISTGLIRSYEYTPSDPEWGTGMQDRTVVYDQALALTAAISSGLASRAKTLVDGLLKLQTTSGTRAGGFVFAAPQLSPSFADPLYRTGAHAIAVDALLGYVAAYSSDPNITTYRAAAVAGLSFLLGTQSTSGATSGLLLGGYGDGVGTPPVFDPSFTISWASTEHNLDAWQTLTHASAVLGDSPVDYGAIADDLDTDMQAKLWNSTEQRFNQGVNGGAPDTADPLDVNSWGAIQLLAAGHTTQSADAMANLSAFEITDGGIDGYVPFYDSPGYPDATPTLWYEGSFGVALALYRVGDMSGYRDLLDSLSAGQESDGSFVYATQLDSMYGISTAKSVASTAWFVIATLGRDEMWNS